MYCVICSYIDLGQWILDVAIEILYWLSHVGKIKEWDGKIHDTLNFKQSFNWLVFAETLNIWYCLYKNWFFVQLFF